MLIVHYLFLVYLVLAPLAISRSDSFDYLYQISSNDIIPHSLYKWQIIEKGNTFSIVSMHVDHHFDSTWYVPSLHSKYSIGWNKTYFDRAFHQRPFACGIKLFGVALESNLEGFQNGGSGYLQLYFEKQIGRNKKHWHGFERNDTVRVPCYYMTNKNYGSEFLDTPKTLGIAIYCPLTLDHEIGEYYMRNAMDQGYFCRKIAELNTTVWIKLRPSWFSHEKSSGNYYNRTGATVESIKKKVENYIDEVARAEIVSEFQPRPSAARQITISEEMSKSGNRDYAVCTVITFRNQASGPMLFLFASYYQKLGWQVIIYDRFGWHREFLSTIIHLPGIQYHPYTVYQLNMPNKYNDEFRKKQSFDFKYFYRMEGNWGYTGSQVQDTADQDADKARTYDFARIENSHLGALLFIDTDELLFCPHYVRSASEQAEHHLQLMDKFRFTGVDEMRFVRLPYSGLWPSELNILNRSTTDLTNHTSVCMINAYEKKDIVQMLECWSNALSFDNFPKSADLRAVCPFHYNHWSCEGMRNGGRDAGKDIPRCRCKVAFDMMNGYEYKPMPKKCHLMHLNNNKYRFESRRAKHVHDKGNILSPNLAAEIFKQK
jgi:hypothetical protein